MSERLRWLYHESDPALIMRDLTVADACDAVGGMGGGGDRLRLCERLIGELGLARLPAWFQPNPSLGGENALMSCCARGFDAEFSGRWDRVAAQLVGAATDQELQHRGDSNGITVLECAVRGGKLQTALELLGRSSAVTPDWLKLEAALWRLEHELPTWTHVHIPLRAALRAEHLARSTHILTNTLDTTPTDLVTIITSYDSIFVPPHPAPSFQPAPVKSPCKRKRRHHDRS